MKTTIYILIIGISLLCTTQIAKGFVQNIKAAQDKQFAAISKQMDE